MAPAKKASPAGGAPVSGKVAGKRGGKAAADEAAPKATPKAGVPAADGAAPAPAPAKAASNGSKGATTPAGSARGKAAAKAPAKKAPARKPAKGAEVPAHDVVEAPAAASGPSSEGIGGQGAMWEHFDARFLESQRKLLLEERVQYTGSAESLEAEARQLTEEYEPGDVQFDDESGEGDSIVVERDRDLALSAQAQQIISEIDAALERLRVGTYGVSEVSGLPIPKERLKAIPWTSVRVEEKVGGIGHRR